MPDVYLLPLEDETTPWFEAGLTRRAMSRPTLLTRKPRLTFRGGWWYCRTPEPSFGLGIGRTPREAYLDWQYT